MENVLKIGQLLNKLGLSVLGKHFTRKYSTEMRNRALIRRAKNIERHRRRVMEFKRLVAEMDHELELLLRVVG